MTASPAKLRDGTWGARITLDAGITSVPVGQYIRIRTAGGKEWTAAVARVLWQGQGVAIVATRSLDRQSSRSDGREDCRRYGWDGVVGSRSYYTSGQYDEDS